MRILIDVNHPAHVHLFRNAAREWEKRGHAVFWTARDKDLVVALLDRYGFSYEVLSSYRAGVVGMALDLLLRDWKLFRYACKVKPDVMLGTSTNIAHVCRVYPAKSIFFTESDPHLIKLISYLTFPFAHALVMPATLADTWKHKQYKHNSSHKLAYLHPNWFEPDPSVLKRLGVAEGEPYFVVRFIAWGASHDIGQGGLGLDAQRRLVEKLRAHGKVFITSEKPLPAEFEPYRFAIEPDRIHDALYYARLFVGDSQSMTMEAAFLATPSLRCNSMVGRTTAIDELESKYDLAYGFLPDQVDALLAKVDALLGRGDLKAEWSVKRDRYLSERDDLTAWMVDFVERFPTRGKRRAS